MEIAITIDGAESPIIIGKQPSLRIKVPEEKTEQKELFVVPTVVSSGDFYFTSPFSFDLKEGVTINGG